MKRFELGQNHKDEVLEQFVPKGLSRAKLSQQEIPALAKDRHKLADIEASLSALPTFHHFHLGNSVEVEFPPEESVHLVVTSPPYWTLKKYNNAKGQLGDERDYEEFNRSLTAIWKKSYKSLVPGGRLVVVVGDVCLSRRQNNGRHTVIPLHATIQESCRKIGYDNLAPIIWHKIANAKFEAGGGSILGKPYEPNCVVKNDVEFILMFRKSGGYRKPSDLERRLSVISAEQHSDWFQQIWTGVNGASTKGHPAPYPEKLATRLIRMFSFVGDTVLDPFLGSGTTAVCAWKAGRNSIGIEVDKAYLKQSVARFNKEASVLGARPEVKIYGNLD